MKKFTLKNTVSVVLTAATIMSYGVAAFADEETTEDIPVAEDQVVITDDETPVAEEEEAEVEIDIEEAEPAEEEEAIVADIDSEAVEAVKNGIRWETTVTTAM